MNLAMKLFEAEKVVLAYHRYLAACITGMGPAQSLICYRLLLEGGSVRQGAVTHSLYAGTNGSYNLKVLLVDGYVRIDKHPRDKRIRMYHLTDAGKELAHKVAEALEDLGRDKSDPPERLDSLNYLRLILAEAGHG